MGMFDWLFRRTTPPSMARRMSTADADKIIKAYGAAMMSKKGLYADASELPYPKVRIREALIIGIAATQDEKARALYRNGYVTLADWQEGIGPGLHDLDVADRPGETIQENAKRLLEASPAYMEHSKRVIAEMHVLLAELKSIELKLFKG